MSVFKCEKCGCAENTALGWYWSRRSLADEVDLSDVGEEFRGKALCSECAPTRYKDGTPTGFTHRWHGKFPKLKFESRNGSKTD